MAMVFPTISITPKAPQEDSCGAFGYDGEKKRSKFNYAQRSTTALSQGSSVKVFP